MYLHNKVFSVNIYITKKKELFGVDIELNNNTSVVELSFEITYVHINVKNI